MGGTTARTGLQRLRSVVARGHFLMGMLSRSGWFVRTAMLSAALGAVHFEEPTRLAAQLPPPTREAIRLLQLRQLPAPLCSATLGEAERHCQLAAALRQAVDSGTKDAFLPVRGAAERLVVDYPKSPEAWYLLGALRAAQSRLGAFSQEGAEMPSGMSLRAGAIRAYARALSLDPDFDLALDAMAAVPTPREGKRAFAEALTQLRAGTSRLTASAVVALARVEREAGHSDSAVALLTRALLLPDADSGVTLFELARDLHAVGRPTEGREALIAGAAFGSPAASAAYRDLLDWVAAPQELTAWAALPLRERPDWLRAFWARRDVLDGRAEGERLAEHYRRLEYALAHYPVALPQVGRARSLSFGRPLDLIREYYARDEAKRETFLEDLRRFVNDSKTIGSESPFRYYKPTQELVDDRGVVYIRHGAPTREGRTTGGDALEVWVYDRPQGRVTLSFRDAEFDGTVAASVLIPTLLTLPPPDLVQLCHLDQTICPMEQRFVEEAINTRLNREIQAAGQRLSTDAIVASRDRGRRAIDTATTTDSHRRRFDAPVIPSTQAYGLARFPGQQGVLVVGFALAGAALDSASTPGAGTRVVYPLRIQLAAARLSDGKRFSLDTLRQFATAAPLGPGDNLSGLVELPLPPGAYAVSVVYTQPSGRGAVASIGTVTVPGPTARLALSDLVLGDPASRTRWSSGLSQVPLNPLNAFAPGSEASLYLQVAGAQAGTSYRFVVELLRADKPGDTKPELSIAFDQTAPPGAWEVSRALGLAKLRPGRYRVQVVVHGSSGAAESRAIGYLTMKLR